MGLWFERLRRVWRGWGIVDGTIALWERSKALRLVVTGSTSAGAGATVVSVSPWAPWLPTIAVGLGASVLIALTLHGSMRWAVAQREKAVALINIPHLSDIEFSELAAATSADMFHFLQERHAGLPDGMSEIVWSSFTAADDARRIEKAQRLHAGETEARFTVEFRHLAGRIIGTAVRRGIITENRGGQPYTLRGLADLMQEVSAGPPSKVRRAIEGW